MKPPTLPAEELARRLGMLSPRTFTTDEVLTRLETLWRKLDDEGWHVRANTVSLAIEEIKRLSK